MQNSKIFGLVRQLSKSELNDFLLFIDSPYFNRNKDIKPFVKQLATLPLKGEESASKEDIFQKIFTGDYEARKISDLTYFTTLLIELFLSIERIKEDEYTIKINLLPEARKHNMTRVLLKTYTDIQEILKENQVRNSDYAHKQLIFNQEQLVHYESINSSRIVNTLQQTDDFLEIYYTLTKLKTLCKKGRYGSLESLNQAEINVLINSIEERKELFQEYILIEIYKTIIKQFINPDDEKYFYDVLFLLEKESAQIPKNEKREIYADISRYCYHQIQQNNHKYYHELLKIEQSRLKFGVAYEENFTGTEFRRIFDLGIKAGEFAWASDFLVQYKSKIPIEERSDVYHYCLAVYYFQTNNSVKAMRNLKNHVFQDDVLLIDASIILFKIAYEYEEDKLFNELHENLIYKVDHAKHLSETDIESVHDFLKYGKRLYNLKRKLPYQRDRYYKKQVLLYKSKLEESPYVFDIAWLKQKVMELVLE